MKSTTARFESVSTRLHAPAAVRWQSRGSPAPKVAYRALATIVTGFFFGTTGSPAIAQSNCPLAKIDMFVYQQMEVFDSVRPTNQPPLVQTYAIRDVADPLFDLFYYMGDVYDQALAICYLLERNQIPRACQLADALLFLQDHDAIPDGRLHAGYWPNNLLDLQGQYTSVRAPDIAAGNMSWAAVALMKTFLVTGQGRYLTGAVKCADWILQNLKHDNGPGGFSGGLLGWGYEPAGWRSTEHNIDVFALAQGLHNLTGDAKWAAMAEHAKQFVRAMFATNGYYYTGTLSDGVTINPSPIPADGISWTVLAEMDAADRASLSLQWLTDHLVVQEQVDTNIFVGVKFSSTGSHIQSEMTASAAMALFSQGRRSDAQTLLTNLTLIQAAATNSDGNGIVATPWPDGAPTGYGSAYVNRMHTASSAWTGLALLVADGDPGANPLLPIPGFSVTINWANTSVALSWPLVPLCNYSVSWSTNLVNWTDVPVGQTNQWIDPVPNSGQRFYRIRQTD